MNDRKDIKAFEISIGGDEDVIHARQKIRSLSQEMGFSMLEQTRLITAVSELARNIVVHVGEGRVSVYREEERKGIRVVFEDNGPGIPVIAKAMEEGYSTVGSLGLGLKGSKRLVDEFDIKSEPGKGTRVEIVKWL
jgi:serine/threonine-protein kinase RsbT